MEQATNTQDMAESKDAAPYGRVQCRVSGQSTEEFIASMTDIPNEQIVAMTDMALEDLNEALGSQAEHAACFTRWAALCHEMSKRGLKRNVPAAR